MDLETHLLIPPWAVSAGSIRAIGLIFISFYITHVYIYLNVSLF